MCFRSIQRRERLTRECFSFPPSRNPYVFQVNSKQLRYPRFSPQRSACRNPYVFQVNSKQMYKIEPVQNDVIVVIPMCFRSIQSRSSMGPYSLLQSWVVIPMCFRSIQSDSVQDRTIAANAASSRNPYVFQVNSKEVLLLGMTVPHKVTGRNPYVFQVNSKPKDADKPNKALQTLQGRNPYVFQVNSKLYKGFNKRAMRSTS